MKRASRSNYNFSSSGQKVRALENYSRKRNKKKKIKKKTALLVLFLVAGLVYFLVGNTDNISFHNGKNLGEEEIMQKIEVEQGVRRSKIVFGVIGNALEDIPRIKNAELRKDVWNGWGWDIKEREGVLVFDQKGEIWALDQERVVLGPAFEEEKKVGLKVKGIEERVGMTRPGERLSEEEVKQSLHKLLNTEEAWSKLPVSEVDLTDSNNLKVFTEEGTEVWMGGINDLSKKWETLKYVIPHLQEEDLSAPVDLRNPDQVVVPSD